MSVPALYRQEVLKTSNMAQVKLNSMEAVILNALIEQQNDCTGGQFGIMKDVDRSGFNNNEFAGYISSLKQKDIFEFLSEERGDYKGQYIIRPKYMVLIDQFDGPPHYIG